MKKITMICMSVLLMLAASCKKDKKDEVENAGSGFRATVEQQNGDSKTHLDDLAVKWDSGDAILVKSSTCTTPRGFTTTGSGTTVNFDANETLPADFYAPNYTGYYPAEKFEGDLLTLPATQAYAENTFANGANPMAATSNETLLPFKNICGVLKLQLHSSSACQVRSISITSNTGEQLWGTGTVTLTGGVPALGTLTGGGSTLTLDMGADGAAMSTSESQPTAYYFVVPAGTLGTSFTVKVTETNGKVWSKKANAPQNLIARSHITVLPKLAVDTHDPVTPSTVTIAAGCVDCTYTVIGTVKVPSGTHTCEYGLVYSETDATPTIEEGASKLVVNTETFSGTKDFTADITRLTEDVKYFVRAYAMIDGTEYSSESTVQTVTYSTPKPLPSSWTGGKNPHPFTVAIDKVVYFSQGNLQYIGSAATPYWKFADHQFDFLGNSGQGSTSENADRDLFGWGTSGYHQSDDTYNTNYQPWSTSTSKVNTTYNTYGYGPSTNKTPEGPSDKTQSTSHISGSYYDWGVKNAISNGGNVAGKWRTLTKDEWDYLINSRDNAANLYGEGKVGYCTPGLIILPDDWVLPSGLSFTPGPYSLSNVYSYSEWSQMEAAGAVFLPAAGYRGGTQLVDVGSIGYYWSSNRKDKDKAYAHHLNFHSALVNPSSSSYRCYGLSVRLVSEN